MICPDEASALLGVSEKIRWGYRERPAQGEKRLYAHVPLAALNAADVVPVEAGTLR